MKRFILLILFTILSASVIYPHTNLKVIGGTEIVEEVLIRGNLRIPAKEILSSIHTKHGDQFDQSMIDDDIHRLDATGHFEKVSAMVENGRARGKIVTFQ